MEKAVYTLLTTVFIIFVVFSPRKQNGHNKNGLSTRRLGCKFPRLTFDPLVTKIERLSEEKGLSNNQIIDAVNLVHNKDIAGEAEEDAYDYYSEEGRLNVTLRLIVLFPLLDTATKDGFVSLKELETWNIQQAEERLSYRTLKEYRLHDKDKDGTISYSEYLPRFSKEDIEKNEMEHGQAGWWKQQYVNADVDRSGSLDFDEFNNFLHPEDSNNKEIQKWVVREKIKSMDYNFDGKLDFTEFLRGIYDTYKTYIEFETGGKNVPTAEEEFDKLDKNKDKFLVADELRPILSYLQPGELFYAKYYSGYLIHEADDNLDGKLSLDEMLNHEHIFYNTIFDDDMDGDYDDFHDEL